MNLLLLSIPFSFLILTVRTCGSVDTIAVYQNITDGDTIVSEHNKFEMGFFSPGSSKNRYLGIWFKNTSPHTVVWVANRETPLINTMGIVKLDIHGILSLFNGGGTVIWSSNSLVSGINIVNYPITQLLDTGNLVTKDGNITIWQSFDYPGDTLLQGMKVGKNLITGRETYLTSWRSADDPSPGEYTVKYSIAKGEYPQVYIFKKSSVIETRIGPYNGIKLVGQPDYKPNPVYVHKLEMVVNQKEMYFMYTFTSTIFSLRFIVTPVGKLEVWHLNMINQIWTLDNTLPALDNCDNYRYCGPYGSCNTVTYPSCGCLKGFELKTIEVSSPNIWTNGCRRSKALDCGPGEGFLKFSSMKLPDTQNAVFDGNMTLEECEVACKNNCSCTAYANPNITQGAVECLRWFGELMDIQVYLIGHVVSA